MALQVPRDTTVRLRDIRGGEARTVASPEMLAGGEVRQKQRLGRAVGQAGQALAGVAIKEQEQRNLAKVAAADKQLGDMQREFEDSVRQRHGWQADGVVDEATKFWDEKASTVVEDLENDAQRRAFAEIAARRRAASLDRVQNHQTAQMEKATLETLNATIANDINDAAANAGDDESVRASITGIRRKVNAMSTALGWDSEKHEAQLTEKLTGAHKGVINNLTVQDSAAAEAYYQKNKDEIGGADRGVVEKRIKTAQRLGRAQKAVDAIMEAGGTYTERLEKARQTDDPEERKLRVQMVREREAEQQGAIKDDQKDAWNTASAILGQDGRGVRDIPAEVWDRMDGEHQKKAYTLAKDLALAKIKADPAHNSYVYHKVRDAALQDPEGFRSEDLSAYTKVLLPEQIKALRKLQEDPEEVPLSMTRDQIIQAGVAAVGLKPSHRTKKGVQGDRVRAYHDRINAEIKAYATQHGKVTNADIQDITDRLAIKVFSGGWLDSGTAAGRTEIEGVPTDMIDELAAAVEAAGQPVTEENILTLYRYTAGGS